MYRLTYSSQAKQALTRRLPRRDALRIQRALHRLAANPARRDLDIDTLKGRAGYRLRLGASRIIFVRDGETRIIHVLRISPRGDVYKR